MAINLNLVEKTEETRLEFMKPEIRDLKNPTAVNEAVAGTEVPMGDYFTIMQMNHA